MYGLMAKPKLVWSTWNYLQLLGRLSTAVEGVSMAYGYELIALSVKYEKRSGRNP